MLRLETRRENALNNFKKAHGDKYDYSKVKYVNANSKVCIICPEHGEFWQTPNNHKSGKGCSKCSKNMKLTIEEVVEKIRKANKDIKIISDTYINSTEKLIYECLICGFVGSMKYQDLIKGVKCSACSNRTATDNNCLATTRPDLIKYFCNSEDAFTITQGSHKKIQLKCPHCGMLKEKLISTYQLTSCGFSCNYCRDNFSMPEKFVKYLFRELSCYNISQYSPIWSNGLRYDFYIPSLNMIIETHGEQHYKECNLTKRTLKEEQENDLLKYNLAIQNGIKPNNYIVIDCRKSEYEWLKENCIKELSNIFNLKWLDFENIFNNCQNPLVIEVWNAWNNKNENDTTLHISNKFGINRSTIINWLKRGNDINKCNYDPKEEMRKCGRIQAIKNNKIISFEKQFSYN